MDEIIVSLREKEKTLNRLMSTVFEYTSKDCGRDLNEPYADLAKKINLLMGGKEALIQILCPEEKCSAYYIKKSDVSSKTTPLRVYTLDYDLALLVLAGTIDLTKTAINIDPI